VADAEVVVEGSLEVGEEVVSEVVVASLVVITPIGAVSVVLDAAADEVAELKLPEQRI